MVGHTRAADTWGISGPDFLIWYAGLAAAVSLLTLVLVVWFRRRGKGTPGHFRDLGDRVDAGEVAYLRGGAQTAVLSSLAALRARGLVLSPRKGQLAASRTTVPGGLSPLERAIHEAIRRRVDPRWLHYAPAVRRRLEAIDARLTKLGLLLTRPQRTVLRILGYGLTATAALGVVRLYAGLAGDKPVGFLVFTLLGYGAVLLGLAHKARLWASRNSSGDELLVWLTRRFQHLHPSRNASWKANGAPAAAMSVAVFGAAALVASDPTVAARLSVSRSTARADSGGGLYGGGMVAGDGGGGGDGGG